MSEERSEPGGRHPGSIREHPLEDCPVCQELGDWATCENSIEWIEAHQALRELDELTGDNSERGDR